MKPLDNIGISREGPVTVAIITAGDLQFVGVAKCNPIDRYSEDIGSAIATARAARKLADYTEKLWVGRAVTKKQWQEKHS